MACGTPVIATGRGSVPKVVMDGETGFIVGSADEAVAAIGRVGALDRRHIRNHVAGNFSREQMVDNYLEVYRKILETGCLKHEVQVRN